jgi:hypothetical protein
MRVGSNKVTDPDLIHPFMVCGTKAAGGGCEDRKA